MFTLSFLFRIVIRAIANIIMNDKNEDRAQYEISYQIDVCSSEDSASGVACQYVPNTLGESIG
jgi:hypothetical protein